MTGIHDRDAGAEEPDPGGPEGAPTLGPPGPDAGRPTGGWVACG